MIIEELTIKNFKSFGNNTQKITLDTENGQLILLSGSNGNGKSSLLESIDYALYNKVQGNKNKWSTLTSLPNRINGGDLEVGIKFRSQSTNVEVRRGMKPNLLELIENGIPNIKSGNSNINDKIENYIGMDIETFKSFISMSINDFKNFISLTSSEKKMLLDKLFNLEVINILNDILKGIRKENKKRLDILDAEINTLDESIRSIKESIKKAIESAVKTEKESIKTQIDELKNSIATNRDEYVALNDKMIKIGEKELQLKQELDKENKQLFSIQNDIKNVTKEIELYDLGKCPTCSTDFKSDYFVDLRQSLIDKKESCLKVQNTIKENISLVNEKGTKLNGIKSNVQNAFNDIKYLLKGYKDQIAQLEKKERDNIKLSESKVDVKEFETTILNLENRKERSISESGDIKNKDIYYDELAKIFSDDGVKKSIINGIITPLNFFIEENIEKMGLSFQITLDDSFNATIRSLGSEIDHNTLSTGENKRLNLLILIAYIKLIRTKKHINILFLDEVFASIDVEGIDSILRLLKSFANDYNINIFVVHHAILSTEMFDRILHIEKDIFSSIKEIVI